MSPLTCASTAAPLSDPTQSVVGDIRTGLHVLDDLLQRHGVLGGAAVRGKKKKKRLVSRWAQRSFGPAHTQHAESFQYLCASRSTAFHMAQESSASITKGHTSPAGPPPSRRRLRSSSRL